MPFCGRTGRSFNSWPLHDGRGHDRSRLRLKRSVPRSPMESVEAAAGLAVPSRHRISRRKAPDKGKPSIFRMAEDERFPCDRA